MKSYSEILKYLEKDKILTNAIKSSSYEVKPELDIDVYRALLNSIVSQQLSVKVVDIIWRRFEDLFIDGYPKAKELLAMEDGLMRNTGLSRAKTQYLKNVAAFSLENDMSFDYLTTIKGVGKWTVQMILMFPMDRLNVFPVDDLGIQQRMMNLYTIDVEKKMLKSTLNEIAEYDYPIVCTFFFHLQDTEAITTLSNTELKYLLLNL